MLCTLHITYILIELSTVEYYTRNVEYCKCTEKIENVYRIRKY